MRWIRSRLFARVRRALVTGWLATSAVMAAGAAEPAPNPDGLRPAFEGALYEIGSERQTVLYRWEAWQTPDGERQVDRFRTPDGTLVARQRLELNHGVFRRYEVDHFPADQHGAIQRRGDRIEFTYTKEGGTKTGSEKVTPNFIVGPMLVPYIQSHWGEVARGKDLSIRLGVANRVESVAFTISRQSITTWENDSAVVVRIHPSSWLIARLVDPIDLTFRSDGRLVYRAVGRTIPLRRVDGAWKPVEAEGLYHPARP